MAQSPRSRFATTHWSLVIEAAGQGTEPARAALAELCESYWYPLYAFARRSGRDPDDARDLTQGFFAELLAKGYLAQADRERGRFRTFLLAAFRHFASKERDRNHAQKRGGSQAPLSLDYGDGERRYGTEPADPTTPERLFERRWALTLLARAIEALRGEYTSGGKERLFAQLEPFLGGGGTVASYREIGSRLGMSEAAVKVAAHRLKRRYGEHLRSAIAITVASPDDVDDELRQLIAAVG